MVKYPPSCQKPLKKLRKNGRNISIDDMVEYVNDIAGIRITCSFFSEVYFLADMLARQDNLSVLNIKDYIGHPKESGYKSYHMLLSIQVALADAVIPTKVEVQIRTIAMDFWASLDHQLKYKKPLLDSAEISQDLKRCADIIAQTDEKMLSIRQSIESQGILIKRDY